MSCAAGTLTHFHASIGSTLCVLAFLYAFWYVGKAWPSVSAAGGGFFSMQQVQHLPCLCCTFPVTAAPACMHVSTDACM